MRLISWTLRSGSEQLQYGSCKIFLIITYRNVRERKPSD
jgi:hypothetical protein